MKKFSLVLAVVFSVNLLFAVPIDLVSAEDLIRKKTVPHPPFSLNEVIQENQSEDYIKYKKVEEEIKQKGVNLILRTELELLERKANTINTPNSWRQSTSNLRKDLQGGFDYGSMNNELEILTGMRAVDESLQIGSIGEDLDLQRQREGLKREVERGIEDYKKEKGNYPESLEDFEKERKNWAKVWWDGENRNIAEVADLFEYRSDVYTKERKARTFQIYNILTETEKNDTESQTQSSIPLTIEQSKNEQINLPKSSRKNSLFGQIDEICDETYSDAFIDGKVCKSYLQKRDFPIFKEKVYYQFCQGDKIREAENTYAAFDDLIHNEGKDCNEKVFLSNFTLTFKPQSKQGTINISDISALEIESHDYEQMIVDEKLEYEMPEIAKYVPADDFLVHFDTEKFVSLKSALEKLVHPVTAEFGLDFADLLKIENLIFDRLGIPENDNFYNLISEFAFVSEDLDFFKRTDFAVIVKFKNDSSAFIAKVLQNGENAFEQVGDYFVFATDKSILEKIQKTHLGGVENMSSQGDFKYALGVLEKKRDGLVYFSDSFIRKLTSPVYRLNSRRKNTVLTALETLQYTSWAYKDITGKWAKDFAEIEEEGFIWKDIIFEVEKYSIDEKGIVHHADWGSIVQPVPVNRVQIEKIMEGEKNLYENFRERYHSYYTEFFDPIGVAVVVADKIALHTVILPLIENSDYNWLRTFFGGNVGKEFDFIANPDRDAGVIATATFDFDNVLLKMVEEMVPNRQFGQANDAQRRSDLNAMANAISQYKVDNRGKTPNFSNLEDALVPTYLSSMPRDPITNEMYQVDTWDNGKCYRVVAQLEEARETMKNDEGIDPNLYEFYRNDRDCDINEAGFELVEVQVKETKEEPVKTEEEIKMEKILAMEQEIRDELDLDDLEFGEGERIFDFMGDEVMFGIGQENEFAENTLANLDVYLGLKLSNPEKAKKLLDVVFTKIAEEMKGNRRSMGMMLFSSSKPLKNTYNEVEYFMVPTGFLNVYYAFIEDRFYLAISQLAMNKIIDGYTKGEANVASQHERTFDFIGKAKNIMLLVDTANFQSWIGADIQQEVIDEFEYELVDLLDAQIDYAKEAMTLRRILDNPDDLSKIYKNIPENFLDMKFVFDEDGVFLETGEQKIDLYQIETGNYYAFAKQDNSLKIVTQKILEKAGFDLDPIFEIFNSLESAGLGFAFTEHGIDVRIAFGNPLETEKDLRFSAEEIDEEISDVENKMMEVLMQKKSFYLILFVVILVVFVRVVVVRKK